MYTTKVVLECLYAYSDSRTTTNENIRACEQTTTNEGNVRPRSWFPNALLCTNEPSDNVAMLQAPTDTERWNKTTSLPLRRPAKTTNNKERRAKRRERWPEFCRGKSAGKIHGSLCGAAVWQIVYVYKTYFSYLLHPELLLHETPLFARQVRVHARTSIVTE